MLTLPRFFFFFFQAEDGIRDHCVTGVQTCALPICAETHHRARAAQGLSGRLPIQRKAREHRMQASAHIDTFARDNLPPPDQWPEFLLDGPDVAYPERLNCAAELVDAMVARGQGGRVALRWRQGADQAAMTYAELQALTNRIAHVLVEDLQLVPGNRLLLRGPNNAMMAASWLAAIKAGLVTVPTMPLLRAKELQQIIAKAQVQAVLCDVRLKDEVQLCLQPGHEHHCPGLSRVRSEEHTSELQSHSDLVCRLLLEKKNNRIQTVHC